MRKSVYVRRISLAVFGIIFVTIVAGSPDAQATSVPSGVLVLDTPVAPQQLRGESELPWLFAVYIVTWAAFFGYVFVMSRRQREMRREIEVLKRVLADRGSEEAPVERQTRET